MPAKGESLPKPEHPAADATQGDQVTGPGESLPSPSQPSGPTERAAIKELRQESLSLPGATQRLKMTLQWEQRQPKQSRWKMLKMNILQNLPRKCLLCSQFPQTLKLCKDLKSGEFLPEEVQLTRLGYGRTRAVYTLPPSAQHTYPPGLCAEALHGAPAPRQRV